MIFNNVDAVVREGNIVATEQLSSNDGLRSVKLCECASWMDVIVVLR